MNPGISVVEKPPIGLLTIRTTDEGTKAVAEAVKKLFSLAWPERLHSTATDELCLRWMSPDEFLLSCPLDKVVDMMRQLQQVVSDDCSVIDVSGGYVVLELTGPDHKDLLKKSTAYDVHTSHFSAGKVVNTTFAKTQATLRSVSDSQVEIIVRRSFFDYIWLWIQTAAQEYGLNAQRAGLENSTFDLPA